jgi:hypothetical protein
MLPVGRAGGNHEPAGTGIPMSAKARSTGIGPADIDADETHQGTASPLRREWREGYLGEAAGVEPCGAGVLDEGLD